MSRDRKAVAHPMVAADLEHPPVALGQRNILVELVPAETGHRSLGSAPHRIDAAQIEFDIEPCPRVGIIVDQKRGRPARTAAVVGQREMIEPEPWGGARQGTVTLLLARRCRSEARRVGKEGVSTCRSRWAA